jgi:hypothetical protein
MKPVATRNFPIQVTAGGDLVDDQVRGLVSGIFEVRLNRQFDFTFIPFQPGMAPPFTADTTASTGVEAWRTPADARLDLFSHSRYVITGHDPLAGQELRYPSRYGAPVPDDAASGEPLKPSDSVVFYVSTEEYEILTADLEKFLEPSTSAKFDDRALDLTGRPVVDFFVDRLPASRLVSDDVLHWLGLKRAVTT